MPITSIFASMMRLDEDPQPPLCSSIENSQRDRKSNADEKNHEELDLATIIASTNDAKSDSFSQYSDERPNKIQKVFFADKRQQELPLVCDAANSVVMTNIQLPLLKGQLKNHRRQHDFSIPENFTIDVPASINNAACSALIEELTDDFSDDDSSTDSSKSLEEAKIRELLPAPFFRYRDHSQESDEDPLLPLTPLARVPNFPAKLHAILSRADFADVISWMPHGRSWRVLKPREFEIRVIPTYFEHQKFSSFIRQANGWGFHRVSQGPDRNSYYHELFLRGLPHLCKKMKRPGVNKKPVVDPDHEPNFDEISELHPLPNSQPNKVDEDILLPFTVVGGPKARMPVRINHDELQKAIAKATSSDVDLPCNNGMKAHIVSAGPAMSQSHSGTNLFAQSSVFPPSLDVLSKQYYNSVSDHGRAAVSEPAGGNTLPLVNARHRFFPPAFCNAVTLNPGVAWNVQGPTSSSSYMSSVPAFSSNVNSMPPLDTMGYLILLLQQQRQLELSSNENFTVTPSDPGASQLPFPSEIVPDRLDYSKLLINALVEQERLKLLGVPPSSVTSPVVRGFPSTDAASQFVAGFAAATALHNSALLLPRSNLSEIAESSVMTQNGVSVSHVSDSMVNAVHGQTAFSQNRLSGVGSLNSTKN